MPRPTGSQIECQRDSGAQFPLNISPEIEAMLRVEATLITSSSVLIQHVGKAERVEDVCRRKPQQDGSTRRPTLHAFDQNLGHPTPTL